MVPLIVLLSAGIAVAQVPVREISIRSSRGGLGTPQKKTKKAKRPRGNQPIGIELKS